MAKNDIKDPLDEFPTGVKCSDHPDAPHGFMRQASHAAGRYVCECEGWKPDKYSCLKLVTNEPGNTGSSVFGEGKDVSNPE